MAVNAWEDPGVHLGSLIPQRHFFLDTAWSPVEVEREIGAVIDPSATYRDRPWRGSRSIAGFWMTQRAHRSRAEARIIASGRVGPTAAGSRVAMTVRLPFMVSLFIGIYLGGVALGGIAAIVVAIAQRRIEALVFWIIPAGQWTAARIMIGARFVEETRRAEEFLRRLFPPPPPPKMGPFR